MVLFSLLFCGFLPTSCKKYFPRRWLCHSIFAMSLARSFHSDPHGMIFIHASCDQPLMNSPITKLSFVILTTNGRKNLFLINRQKY